MNNSTKILPNDCPSIEEKYHYLKIDLNNLLNKDENIITNLANFAAFLKKNIEKASWVGFLSF